MTTNYVQFNMDFIALTFNRIALKIKNVSKVLENCFLRKCRLQPTIINLKVATNPYKNSCTTSTIQFKSTKLHFFENFVVHDNKMTIWLTIMRGCQCE